MAFDKVTKTGFVYSTPPAIEQALTRQGMNMTADMGPGRPLTPSKGYSQPPRSSDYPVGVNITTQGRQAWGRTSFAFLREFTSAYDVARICINHKIDELRSMDLLFQPADGVTSDVTDALDAARTVLAFPDRQHPFDEWFSMWLEGLLRYDAGVLYRRRNMNGDIVGLEVLDGPTIVPKIDERGRRPEAPAPAYAQVIKGQDRVDFTTDDIIYSRFRPQPDSPYGLPPIESILMSVNTDMRFQWHLLQMFTEGSVPAGFIELPPDISSPDQVAEWQDYWDAIVQGDQAKKHQLVAVPSGTKMTETRPKGFDVTFPDHLLVKTAAAFGVVPQDLGMLKDVNRSTGDTQVDIQFRVNTLPWVRFAQSVLNRYLQHDLGLPVKVAFDTGRDKEDRLTEAQAWKVYVETGAASMDEMRQELLGLPIDNQRPIPRGLITARTGFIPLTSILNIAGPINAETGSPSDDVPLPAVPFNGAGGIIADKLPGGTEFQRAPIDPDEPQFPALEQVVPGSDVVNGMPAVGGSISKSAAVSELTKFRAFVKARARSGKWRDFEFEHTPPDEAARLNKEGRDSGPFFVKAQPEVSVAGLAVVRQELSDSLDVVLPAIGSAPLAKGWRDTEEKTPQLRYDLKITDAYQPVVLAALKSLIDSADTSTVKKAIDEDALAGLIGQNLSTSELEQAVRNIIADGYMAGVAAGVEQIGPGAVSVSGAIGEAVAATDWSVWIPGSPGAAAQAADGALADLLAKSDVTIKGITDSVLEQVGNALADGLSSGASSFDTADVLAGLDESLAGRAEMIAHTEGARAMTAASFEVYGLNGVTEWDLVTSAGACPICLQVEAANPHPQSDMSSAPPVHPRCRCSSSPVVESIDSSLIQYTE